MKYESNVSVAEDLDVVIILKIEWEALNKELLLLRLFLENGGKPYNNCQRKSVKKRKRRIDTASVYDSTKWWLDLIPIILSFVAFVVIEVLQLDCGSMDRLLYILAVFSQMYMSNPNKDRK